LNNIVHYPESDCAELIQTVAQRFGCSENGVVIGNGSTELLYALTRAFKCKRALIIAPAYVDYARAAELAGMEVFNLPTSESDNFSVNWEVLEQQIRAILLEQSLIL
jgi:threonine-phosphate decarboxylase